MMGLSRKLVKTFWIAPLLYAECYRAIRRIYSTTYNFKEKLPYFTKID